PGAGAAVAAALAACVATAWTHGAPLVPADGGLALGDGRGPAVFLAALAVGFAAYVAGLLALRRRAVRLAVVLGLAAVIQLVPLAAPPLLSTDAWTYWEYGAISVEGGNPYRDPPAEYPENPAYEHAGAAWRDTTSVYGPVFTLLSEGVARGVSSSADAAAWTFKALAALSMLALTGLAALLARERALAAALVGWNPLLAVHFGGGGHNDATMMALVLAALALAATRRRTLAAAAWVLAIAVKWVAAIPFLLRAVEARAQRRPVAHLAFALAAAAVAAAATARYGLEWLRAVAPLAENAATRTSYALPSRLGQLGVPDAVALGLALSALLAGLALLARRARRGETCLGRAGCLLLATTPYLTPWYVVWAVPLAAAEGDRRAQLVAVAFCAYLLPQTVPV
ncbi:MAG TPA: hypothetical protein VM204_02025, partial [Gaiellaceae bacterium]|nr:hypothetical protein [Gaiellaceae bacterium]